MHHILSFFLLLILPCALFSLSIKECLLPSDHHLQPVLQELFIHPTMFDSIENLKNEGFTLISHNPNKIMVASHSSLKGFLIKKFNNHISQEEQLENYLKRIEGARALADFIKSEHLESIITPKKWLYTLSHPFNQQGKTSYLLIVEKLDICEGKGKKDGEVAKRYHAISKKTLVELCKVVLQFRGLDSAPCNMPFTKHNQIAFIDTECWEEDRKEFLPRILPYLPKNKQKQIQNFNNRLIKN